MLLIFAINSVLIGLAVIIHYETLRLLIKISPRFKIRPQLKVAYGVLGAMMAHLLEVWVFAAAYYWLIKLETFGILQGNFDGSMLDCVYFSISAYSSLGIGDIEPTGLLRLVTGVEALTGLLLITWSASFMFLEMQKFWAK